jgi:hypothetical protein
MPDMNGRRGIIRGNCGGSSQSFIEGCEGYQRQDEEFDECESKK